MLKVISSKSNEDEVILSLSHDAYIKEGEVASMGQLIISVGGKIWPE